MITVKPTPESEHAFKVVWDGITGILNLGDRETEKIADAVRRGIALNFATEGAAAGTPWPHLAPMTIAQRRSLGFAGERPILVRTSSLKRSLIERGHPLHVTEISTHGYYDHLDRIQIEIGSADERFPLLHAGGLTDEGYVVPPRPMTVLGDAAINKLESTIIYVLRERWERLGEH